MNFTVRMIFSPVLPLIEDEFMISHARASSIYMFHSTGYAIALFFSGAYLGRFGYKKSILAALCISAMLCLLVPYTRDFPFLYLINFFLGFSVGIYLPSAIALITEYIAEKNWGRSLAIHDSGASAGIFCAPFIALLLLNFVKWRGIFMVFGVAFLCAAAIFYLAADEAKVTHARKSASGPLVKIPAIWTLGAMCILSTGAALGIFYTVPLYLTKELKLSLEYANSVLGISRVGGIVIAISTSFFIDRVNLRKTMFIMMLVTGLLTAFVGLAPASTLWFVLFLQSACAAGFYPVVFLWITRTFPAEARPTVTGFVLTLGIIFGAGGIPYLVGFSGDYVGFTAGYIILGAVVTVCSLLPFTLKRPH